jgi:hypothetical protein
MHPTRRTTRLALAIALPAAGMLGAVGLASAFDGADQPAPTTARFVRVASSSSPQQVDISGPCDELEHADDPRCTGVVTVPATTPTTPTTTVGGGVDISGPCDEAEHVNDPRCTGGAPTDSRGPGPGGDDGDDDRSGHGGGDDDGDDDRSGHGGGDDDGSDDHGSGGHGSDD